MIYLDNAASTMTDPEVTDLLATVMNNFYANPSSAHDAGREARYLIEESRKTIAGILQCEPADIIFTSGGTEAINLLFYNMGLDENIRHIITSPLEHPAVLYSLDHFGLSEKTEFVNILPDATPDLQHLEDMLKVMPGAFVSLMHVNNECGSILDVKTVSDLCRKHGALFFSDTVQSIGKIPVSISEFQLDFAACSAHKFHGPRGIGFLMKKGNRHFKPHTVGGGQENGLRSGTENTASIAAMCKALEISTSHLSEFSQKANQLKTLLVHQLRSSFPEIRFIGHPQQTIPQILSIAIPAHEDNIMLTDKLGKEGFAVSAGSACHATSKKSTLLSCLGMDQFFSLRVSFSKFTTTKEVNEFADAMSRLMRMPS